MNRNYKRELKREGFVLERLTYSYLRTKAIFQIVLLITALFFVALIQAPLIEAQPSSVCCERTTGGAYCVQTEASNCDTNYAQNNAACEQTSFCNLGCCFDSSSGSCGTNVPSAACANNPNTTFFPGTMCNQVPVCQQGCCAVGANYVFGTQQECQGLIDTYYPGLDVNQAWDPSIGDEASCIAQVTSDDEGCCIDSSYACRFGTRGSCSNAGSENNNGGPGFYKDKYCSNPQLQCACEPRSYKSCTDELGRVLEDVYWFDSCGNKEGIAEDCNYTGQSGGSTLCFQDGEDAYCKSVDCSPNDVVAPPELLAQNPQYGRIGVTNGMRHGESWCSYDSGVGNFLDRPGSRHYRHLCISGRELIQPCRDFREEVCVQGNIDLLGVELNQANCLNNEIYESPVSEAISTVPKGQKFWTGDNEQTCDDAMHSCLVGWLKADSTAAWEVTANEFCMTQGYVDDLATMCKAAGDCGADFNVVNDYTDEGFDIIASGREAGGIPRSPSNAKLEEWRQYGDNGGLVLIGEKLGEFVTSAINEEGGIDFIGALAKGIGAVYAIVLVESFLALVGLPQVILGASQLSLNPINLFYEQGIVGEFNDIVGTTLESAQSAVETATQNFDIAFDNYADILNDPLASPESIDLAEQSLIEAGEELEQAEAALEQAEATSGVEFSFSVLTFIVGAIMLVLAETPLDYISAGMLLVSAFFSELIPVVGVIISLINLFLGASESDTTDVESVCEPWVAPVVTDPSQCSKCTDDPRYKKDYYDNPVTCSEYRCKSLGRTCELINPGTLDARCVDSAPNDVTPPVITPWTEVITNQQNNNGASYSVQPLLSTGCAFGGFYIQPPVNYNQRFTWGIKTSEPALCRYDVVHTNSFEEMQFSFDQGVYSTEHTVERVYPGGQDYSFYVRCKDLKDNGADLCEYTVQLRTTDEPDLTAPRIEQTSILNGAALPAGVTETPLTLYLNEQVETCRWSKNNVAFNEMSVNNSFFCGCAGQGSNMCVGGPTSDPSACQYVGSSGFYLYDFECVGILTDVLQEQANTYYISCLDIQKQDGSGCNIMNNYEFTLESSSSLFITNIEPLEGTYYNPNFVLRVITNGGADNGNAACTFNDGSGDVSFFQTGGTVHLQEQVRERGTYTYNIECSDSAGNVATDAVTLTIDVDTSGPEIINLFVEGSTLHVITDEASTCAYSETGPIYALNEGTPMTGVMSTDHTVQVNTGVYYVVCADQYENTVGPITIYV